MSKSSNINKALIWAMMLALAASSLTACAGSNDGDTEHKADSVITDTLDSQEIENEAETETDGTGIFVDFNEDDYSVGKSIEEIYKENDISADDIVNVTDEASGLYFEQSLNLTDAMLSKLMDSTGAYVARLDIETLEITECGDEIDISVKDVDTTDNKNDTDNTELDTIDKSSTSTDETNSVLIMFGDKNILDTDYLKQAFNINGDTRTVFVKGKFRGRVALYPMLVESSTGEVYVYKPYLEMSDTW